MLYEHFIEKGESIMKNSWDYKKGDLVMMIWPPMEGEFAVIIKSKDFGMGNRWLVHLTNGQELWFPKNEMVRMA